MNDKAEVENISAPKQPQRLIIDAHTWPSAGLFSWFVPPIVVPVMLVIAVIAAALL